jgi:hypothetical protein
MLDRYQGCHLLPILAVAYPQVPHQRPIKAEPANRWKSPSLSEKQ